MVFEPTRNLNLNGMLKKRQKQRRLMIRLPELSRRTLALATGVLITVILVAGLVVWGRAGLLRTQVAFEFPEESPPTSSSGSVIQLSLEAEDVYARVATPVTEPEGCPGGCSYPSVYDSAPARGPVFVTSSGDSGPPPKPPPLAIESLTPPWSSGEATLKFQSSGVARWSLKETTDYPLLFSWCQVDGSPMLAGVFPRSGSEEISGTVLEGFHTILCEYYTALVSPERVESPNNVFSLQASVGSGSPNSTVAGGESVVKKNQKALKPLDIKLLWSRRPQAGVYQVDKPVIKSVLQGGETPWKAFQEYWKRGLSDCSSLSPILLDKGLNKHALACTSFGKYKISPNPGEVGLYHAFLHGDWKKVKKDGQLPEGAICTFVGANVTFVGGPDGSSMSTTFRKPLNILGRAYVSNSTSILLPEFKKNDQQPKQSKTLEVHVNELLKGHEELHVKIFEEHVTKHLPDAYEVDLPRKVIKVLKDEYKYDPTSHEFFIPVDKLGILQTKSSKLFSLGTPQGAENACGTLVNQVVIEEYEKILGSENDAYKNPSARPLELKDTVEDVGTLLGKLSWRQDRVDFPQRGNLCIYFFEGRPTVASYDDIRADRGVRGKECTKNPPEESAWWMGGFAGVFDRKWPSGSDPGVPVGQPVYRAELDEKEDSNNYPRLIYFRTK